jgi:hypothetical protein
MTRQCGNELSRLLLRCPADAFRGLVALRNRWLDRKPSLLECVPEDGRYGRQMTIYRRRPDTRRRLLLPEGVECVTFDRGQRFALESFRCKTQLVFSVGQGAQMPVRLDPV